MADYKNPTMRGLESIQAKKFPPSFEANLSQTNQSLEFLSKVVLVMQRGIDEADDTIFDDIKQLVDELIILFGGGTLGDDASFPGLNIFDVLIQNLMSFFGFNPTVGGQNIPNLVGNFIDNILNPTGKIPTKQSVDDVATKAELAQQSSISASANAATARSESALALTAAQSVQAIADDALATADIAYENAQYWEKECVISSAEVLLGVNELLIGMVMDVPTGRIRKITDLHFALVANTGTITIETKLQNVAGNASRVVHTATITNSVRRSYNNLAIDVFDKERVFWNVITPYNVPATVLQVSAVGVLLAPTA